MEENYRYIVYVEYSDEGYYSTYYNQKESNQIEDIVAIVKSEDKAKDMCKDRPDLGYRKIIWED